MLAFGKCPGNFLMTGATGLRQIFGMQPAVWRTDGQYTRVCFGLLLRGGVAAVTFLTADTFFPMHRHMPLSITTANLQLDI